MERFCSVEGCTSRTRGARGICRRHGAWDAPTCKVEGCTRKAITIIDGVCIRHGATRLKEERLGERKPPRIVLCSHEGCTTKAVRGGLCWKHDENKEICSVVGCESQARQYEKDGLCSKHYREINNISFKYKYPPRPRVKKECSHDGCTLKAYKGGACRKHGTKENGCICKYEGCVKQAVTQGLCWNHMTIKCSHDGCNLKPFRKGVCRKHGTKETSHTTTPPTSNKVGQPFTEVEDFIIKAMVETSVEKPFTNWSSLESKLAGREGKQIQDSEREEKANKAPLQKKRKMQEEELLNSNQNSNDPSLMASAVLLNSQSQQQHSNIKQKITMEELTPLGLEQHARAELEQRLLLDQQQAATIQINAVRNMGFQQQMAMQMAHPELNCIPIVITLPPLPTKLGILLDDNKIYGLPQLMGVTLDSPILDQIPSQFREDCCIASIKSDVIGHVQPKTARECATLISKSRSKSKKKRKYESKHEAAVGEEQLPKLEIVLVQIPDRREMSVADEDTNEEEDVRWW